MSYEKFIQATINNQLYVATQVKLLQNRRYYLFVKGFETIGSTRIGDHVVQIGKDGSLGILCDGAQNFLSYQQYVKFLRGFPYCTDGISVWI